jgi:hypothetical protein
MGEVNVRTVGHLTSGRVHGTLGVIVWFGRLVLNACGGGRRCGPQLLTLVQCQYYINPCLPLRDRKILLTKLIVEKKVVILGPASCTLLLSILVGWCDNFPFKNVLLWNYLSCVLFFLPYFFSERERALDNYRCGKLTTGGYVHRQVRFRSCLALDKMHDLRAPKTQNCYQSGSYLVVPIRRQLWALTFYKSDLCARILPLSVTLQALLIYTRCPTSFYLLFSFFFCLLDTRKRAGILQVLKSEVGCSAQEKKKRRGKK